MSNLEGKTALVVGAGRGIGREAAELFAAAGANVAISSRNEAELMELEYKLGTKGWRSVWSCEADAAVETDVESLVAQTIENFGSIDYLVHSAGLGILKPFAELTTKDLDTLLDANLRTAFNVFKHVLPVMTDQKFGRVVVIPGILGKAPMINASAYCAVKYGLTGLVKCLSQEYKRHGVRFSLMHFGGVDSTFWDNIAMKVQREKMLTVEAAAQAVFFAATQPGEGVMSEIVLVPESHQIM